MAKVGSKKNASSKVQEEQRSQGRPIWVFLAILFFVLFLTTLYLYFNKSDSVFSLLTGATTETQETQEPALKQELCVQPIDKNKVSEMAIDYFNQKVLGDGKAVIIRTDESDLVYIIKMAYNNKVYESYVSKDGRFFFPTGYELYSPTPAVNPDTPVSDATV